MKRTKLVVAALVMSLAVLTGCEGKKDNNQTGQTNGTITQAPESDNKAFSIKDDDLALVTKLGDYKSFTYEPFDATVTEEEIQDYIKKLYDESVKDGFKAYIEDEAAAGNTVKNGDTVNIAFEGKIDGKAFDGGTSKSYYLTIGSKTFIDTFEEQLVGAKKGEKRVVKVTFPNDYDEKELAGKAAEFDVTINHFGKETEVTLENCYNTMFGFDSVDKLKEYVKTKLEAQVASQVDDYFNTCQTNYIKYIIDNTTFGDISSLSEEYYNYYYSTMKYIAASNGGSIQDLISAMGLESEDAYKEILKKQAENSIKHDLVLYSIAKIENLTLSDEKFKEYGEKYLSSTTYKNLDEYVKAYDRYYGEGGYRINLEKVHFTNELFYKYAKAEEASGDKTEDDK